MASRHKQVAKALLENLAQGSPLTRQELLVEKVNYTPMTAQSQGESIITHPMVQQELAEQGFTEANAKKVSGNILLDEEAANKDRLRAAELAFKVFGTFAAEKHVSTNLNVNAEATPTELRAIIEESEAKMLSALNKKKV